ncbi:MAG TPA: RDD family protein [Candidatus Acidoferrales bacterium]|nr:RDD family protein [Candidatus Acidoferrales bacterium]
MPSATAQGALAFETLEQEAAEMQEPASPRRTAVQPHPSEQDIGCGENDPTDAAEEFAFAIGIGRKPSSSGEAAGEAGSQRVEIDLTQPVADASEAANLPDHTSQPALPRHADSPYFPVAALAERCLAGAFDAVFLLFSYGGFLTLFGSLGGHFSFSKFSVAVYGVSLGLFYVQYFALFTIFGGATPGMMLRHLQVVSFDGDAPGARQLLQRSLGYLVSGGTFLLGFLWSFWDEDGLTWQDRISRTHLTQLDAVFAADPAGEPGEAHSTAHK